MSNGDLVGIGHHSWGAVLRCYRRLLCLVAAQCLLGALTIDPERDVLRGVRTPLDHYGPVARRWGSRAWPRSGEGFGKGAGGVGFEEGFEGGRVPGQGACDPGLEQWIYGHDDVRWIHRASPGKLLPAKPGPQQRAGATRELCQFGR